jgi:hypothetical protein
MGKLSLSLFALGVAACGSDNKGTADAGKTFMDAPPKVFMDAPPKVFMDAPPKNYDFTCFGMAAPTTAADPVTIAGTTDEFSMNGGTALGGVTVETYKVGTATALDTKTSDATLGTFTTGNLVTGGVPLDGYIKASLTAYRTSYLYPPNKVVANLAAVPVPLISDANFSQLNALVSQQDATNGVLFLTVADCALTPISGATLTVKQGNSDAGTVLDLGSLTGQSALDGLYLVANVPDGDTTIGASYTTMTFPSHVVAAHKKPADTNAEGTLTVSAIVPGP